MMLTMMAGCADETPEAEDVLAPQEVKVEDRSLGAISGVVVDETIRPVAGASLDIRAADGKSASVTSDEMGRFVHEDLLPGVYFIAASAPGFFDTQQAVEVTAGQVAKPKILLQVDWTPKPFHETLDFNGILRVSDWYGTYLLTVMMGNTEFCECEFSFEVPDTVHSFVVEAFWEPNLGDPAHELYFEVEDRETAEGDGLYSTAPFHKVYPRTLFGGSNELLVRVSSGQGVDLDQEFEIFITLFHLAAPPADWSIATAS